MENHDRDLIMKCIASDIELKRLYNQHVKIEGKLDKLSTRKFLTEDEQYETKYLKRKKLYGVDKMMNLIAPYRSSESQAA